MTQFNSRIKLLRKEKNLTQKQMAEIFDITERTYQYYESGSREPSIETLLSIADKLDISMDYLLARTDNLEINK